MSVPYAMTENRLTNCASSSLFVYRCGRVVEHEEVEPLTLHRGQHLEADDEHDVSVAGQRAERRAFRVAASSCSTLRELGRVPAPGRRPPAR